MKKTIDQKIHAKKIKTPNPIIYGVLRFVASNFIGKKYNVHHTWKTDFRNVKDPYILVSNHTSRFDYVLIAPKIKKVRFNFIVGYNEFYRSHVAKIFDMANCIPKKNFVPDLYTIKEINRVIKNKGHIMIFPEGMNSISGTSQPVAVGTGKLIKHLKVPVYYSLIKGGYLSSTKHSLDDRIGRVDVTYDIMFTKEEIEQMTPEEIEEKMNYLLYHDDYKWNLIHQYKYDIKGRGATHLEDLIFYCPKCHKEFTMIGEKDTFRCTCCGNGATIDETYKMTPLADNCIIPETQSAWVKLEREKIKKEIQDPHYQLTFHVKLGNLPQYEYLKDQKTSLIVGEGMITIDKTGLTYVGTRNNENFSFHIDLVNLPTYGMCTDMSRFYTFYHDEFMEFYPEQHIVYKAFIVTEELHRLYVNKWKDYSFDVEQIKEN